MFKLLEDTELNQISLTGTRALVLVGLLMKAPRSLEEIREAFIDLKIMEPEHSDDILRIDLNTLRIMGCEISRSSAKTGYKYVLTKHPFCLDITSKEVSLLNKIYKRIKDNADISLLLKYDELFKKLAFHIADDDVREELYGISSLKKFNIEEIDKYREDCVNNRILNFVYKSPTAKESGKKEVCAQSLVFQNDKIYLYAYDLKKQESVIFNIKRIKSILSRKENEDNIEVKETCVKFLIKDFGMNEIAENEKIVETNENGHIVEGKYHNDFVAVQRMLSFGANCTVLEPQAIRAKIIEKLKDMRKNYDA